EQQSIGSGGHRHAPSRRRGDACADYRRRGRCGGWQCRRRKARLAAFTAGVDMESRAYFASHAWLPQGFARDVRIEVDHGRYLPGALLAVDAGGAPDRAEALDGYVVPGMPNL